MHDELKSVACDRRPKSLSLFPGGLAYLRSWRQRAVLAALLLPVFGSAGAQFLREGKIGGSIVILVIGGVVTPLMYVAICARMISSNTGTYFRESEPIRYWLSVSILIIGYLGFASAGHIYLR